MVGVLSSGRRLSSTLFNMLTPYTTTPDTTAITAMTTANGSQSGVFFFFLRRRGGSTCRAGCAEWRGGALRPLPDVLPAAGLPDVPVVPAVGRGAAFAA